MAVTSAGATASSFVVPAPVGLAEWDREWAMREDVHELVEGVPVPVSPAERRPNVRAAMLLGRMISLACEDEVDCLPGIEVLVSAGPRPTVRRPDLVVTPFDAADVGYRLTAAEIMLVAEVLSASTERVDTGAKVAEYATAGIPAYLLVDVRADEPVLVLHSDPDRGRYTSTRSGPAVTVPVGDRSVRVDGAALLRPASTRRR